MAFSSTQDFYFSDSGNYQIRKLYTHQSSLRLCTLLGSKPLRNQHSQSLYLEYEGRLLAGHLAMRNEHMSPKLLMKLQIDKNDNMWWNDYSDNRMYVTPLNDFTFGNVGGFMGKYVNFYLTHFLTSPQQKNDSEPLVIAAFEAWLPLEGLFVENQDNSVVVRESGYSYWAFAQPSRATNTGIMQSKWCDLKGRDRRNCRATTVQQLAFLQVMGTCFDVANNMYLIDAKNSELIYVFNDDPTTHSVVTTAQERAGSARKMSTKGCPCLRMWVESALEDLPDDWLPYNCLPQGWELGDGPVAGAPATEFLEDGLRSIMYPADHPRAGEYVRCTVENYCGAPYGDTVSWCYHDSAATTGPLDQCNRVGVVGLWGYCAREGLGITWNEKIGPPHFMEGTTLLGNELRLEKRLDATADMLLDIQLNLTADYSLRGTWEWSEPSRSMIRWSQLVGFEPPGSSTCGCCGLREVPDWYASGGGASTVCLLVLDEAGGMSAEDRELFAATPLSWIVQTFDVHPITTTTTTPINLYAGCEYDAENKVYLQTPPCDGNETNDTTTTTTALVQEDILREVKLVWMELSAVELDPPETTINECQDRCGLNKNCKAVAVMCSEPYTECRGEKTGELCVLFGETWPYYIYELTGSRNVSRLGDSSYVEDVVDGEFSGSLVPLSRFFGGGEQVHVGPSTWENTGSPGVPRVSTHTVSGPHSEYAVRLDDCKRLCVLDPSCTAIAFPGCYLTSLTGMGNMHLAKTAVYVKTYGSLKARGIAGHPEVYSFAGDSEDISRAFLGMPMECAISASGEVYFSDTWNHRVRKVTNIHHKCQHVKSQKISLVDTRKYIDALAAVERNCTNSTDAVVRNRYESAQNGVFLLEMPLSDRTSNLQSMMCDMPGATDPPARLPTGNMLVLCEICSYIRDNLDDHSHTETYNICPLQDMCYCRSAVVSALQTKVYLNCPTQHAYYDEWHHWLTSFLSCYMHYDEADVRHLTDETLRCSLVEQIRVLENRPRSENMMIRGDPCRCSFPPALLDQLATDSADDDCTPTNNTE